MHEEQGVTAFPEHIQISQQAADEYEEALNSLISAVDKRMSLRLEEENLISSNPLSVMYDNHENHGRLLVNVLKFNDGTLLENILPWVVNNYTAKGFSPKYFVEVLDQWKKAIAQHLSPQASEEIIPVYEWMEKAVGELFEQLEAGTLELPDAALTIKLSKSGEIREFVDLLISGRHQEAHAYIADRARDKASLMHMYADLIRPAMYEVGRLWETNKITVAHEHLATSIIMRLITYFYMDVVSTDQTKGTVIVTSSANEYHEIGARIVADFLEMDGWDVTYLGANTPVADLLEMLKSVKPDILCISITMAFNFTKIRELIQRIRDNPDCAGIKIMVGGFAFTYSSTISDSLGSDALALSAAESIKVADNWWKDMQHG